HEDRFGAPYYHVYRPDLHSILANRVEELKPGAIHLNSTVASYTEDADGVVLTLASGERMQGDILVGADGIHSVVREQMHGKEKPKFTGNVAWRVMIPADKIPRDYQPHIFVNWMGPKKHMVVYWVNE
ncbi:FAD-dependent monooxygenase, partial [Sulfitobacter sp. HI0129]